MITECCLTLAVFSAERKRRSLVHNHSVVLHLQCFQLKEREEYLKLLQQHTTVDLGYHVNKPRGTYLQGTAARDRHAQRCVWLHL